MDASELDQAGCLVDFLQLYVEDAQRGELREWEHYARRFPGYEALVEREYAVLRRAPPMLDADTTLFPVLHGYRVVSELGRGGQGTVYLAEDEALHRLVALKVIRTTLGRSSAPQRARLEREVGILAKLDHPGLCTVFRAHTQADPPFVAMRYVPGPTLLELIASSASPCMPARRAELEHLLLFFEDAARALHVAHEAGIIHRDIKPGNVVYEGAGRPVLLDFGLARPVDDRGYTLTLTGELYGTPAYMSPEQLLQPSDSLDRRTDVYSLGVTLFECLTLRRPFEEPSQRQLERAICEEPPPPASRRNPALPADLDVVLQTALEKDLRRRYATALDLAEELRLVRERRPIRARPTSAILRARRWAQRNPVVAMAVLLLTLGAAGMTVALVSLSLERARTAMALRLAESRTLAASALTMLQRDPVKALSLALEADELVPGVDSRVALYRALADQQVERVIETPAVFNTAAFSPDRSALAVAAELSTRMLVVRLPDGGHLLDVMLPTMARAVAVTDGARLVAVGLADGRVLLYTEAGAHEPRTLSAGSSVVRSLAFSPDGTLLAIGGDDDLVRLWDVAAGRELAAMGGSLGPACGLAFSPDGSLLASWVQELPDLPDRPDPAVRLWDVAGRRPAATLAGHDARVTTARFSSDGLLLASASDDGTARVWDLATGGCRFVLEHPGEVNDLAFSPDGTRLATAFSPGDPAFSQASGAWVFSLADGQRQAELLGHEARPVASIEWAPDGSRIATGSYDGTARIWDGSDGAPLACIRAREGNIKGVRWLDSGTRLLIRYGRTVHVVRPEGGVGMPVLTGHAAPVVCASFSADSAHVATSDTAGVTLVHAARTGETLARQSDGPAAVLASAWYGDGRLLAASSDGRCRVFDTRSGNCLLRIAVGEEPVRLLRVLPGAARFVASSGADLAVFALDDGRRLFDLRGHEAELRCLDVSPDGRLLATGAHDRSTRIWDLSTGACLHVLRDWLPTAFESELDVYSVLFHPDGGGLLTNSEDGVAREYSLPSVRLLRSSDVHARVGTQRWLDGGRRAVLMSKWANALQFLDLDTFERRTIEPPVVGRMLAIDVSPDDSLVLAAATDGTTMLWNTRDMQHWASVGGHSGPVLCAAFAPDGSAFLTASTDGIARLWPTDPAAAARARRPVRVLLDPP